MTDPASLSDDALLLQRRRLRRECLAQPDLQPIRIAVLGGSTTEPLVQVLEVLLLASGFRPEFHQGSFGRWYEEAVLDTAALEAFRPELVYVFTGVDDLRYRPGLTTTEGESALLVERELERFRAVWDSLQERLDCVVLQNNFELPLLAPLGSMDAVSAAGLTRFVLQVNAAMAQEIAARSSLLVQDVLGLSARLGLERWFDPPRWHAYKLRLQPAAELALARAVAATVRALFGRLRKVLVLDLDNTLWGGVIGDDGVEGIQLGQGSARGEAHLAFQQYCLQLKQRGVLLAVCSKNDSAIARAGLEHPDSVLNLSDISSFCANWEPKHENVAAIARELNVGLDSLVFVDDNPAERAIVQAQLPMVAVPDVGSDVARFAAVLDRARYFEAVSLSVEDLQRSAQYACNAQRSAHCKRFADYGEYLDSLAMIAEIDSFQAVDLQRIAQLVNKSNQFNLTTRRYTLPELQALAADANSIAIAGRLSDRFGDNGLVSVVAGHRENDTLHIDLWLMSCRVLKREMELAMLDALVEHAQAKGLRRLTGLYLPTAKNALVAEHYSALGFTQMDAEDATVQGTTLWQLSLAGYAPRGRHLRVLQPERR